MTAARKQFSEAVKRPGAGRYQSLRSASLPAAGVARPAPSQQLRTAIGAVPDPFNAGERILVTVNTTDLLENERSRGRISEAAYRVGNAIVEAYEGRRASDAPNDKVDCSRRDPDHAVVRSLDIAQRRVALQQHIESLVGAIGAKMLRKLLIDGMSFATYAAQVNGRTDRMGASYVADRFRSALEGMADSWAAKG